MAKDKSDSLAALPSQARPSPTGSSAAGETAAPPAAPGNDQVGVRSELSQLADWLEAGAPNFTSRGGFSPPLPVAHQKALAERGQRLRQLIGRLPAEQPPAKQPSAARPEQAPAKQPAAPKAPPAVEED